MNRRERGTVLMTQEQIDRINELYRLSKRPGGLSEDERAEQAALRGAYIRAMKESLTSQLDHTYLVEEDGSKTPLKHNPK